MDFKLCDESQVEENAIKLDAPTEINIPDIKELSFNIIKVLEFMNQEDMKSLKISNNSEYEARIQNTFPKFVENFYSIYKMIMSGQNIKTLIEMLRQLDKVKENKIDFDVARNKISALVNKQYVDPVVSKKRK